MLKTFKQKTEIIGNFKAAIYNLDNPKAQQTENRILHLISLKHEKWKDPKAYNDLYQYLIRELRRLALDREHEMSNIVVTEGRAQIAQRITGLHVNDTIIDDGALGTGTTSPTNSDTTLEAEVFRKAKASESTTDNTAFIAWSYSKADTNGTYEEFRTFINGGGNGNPDTGKLFSRFLTGGWTKSSDESMTISGQYTFN